MKAGDKVKFKNPEIWDYKEHTILNVQRTHGDMCYFLHYWNWLDEDELVLVKDNMNKVNVGDYFNDGTLSRIVRITGTDAYYNEKDKVPVEYAYQHRVSILEEKEDVVVSPAHYTTTAITTLDVVNDWSLDFYLGNTVKYIQRHTLKGNAVQDLKKAAQYLQLKINLLEKNNG